MSDQIANRAFGQMRLTRGNLLLPLAFLILLSMSVKCAFLWDSYFNGFLPRNPASLFSDEITYLEEGRLFFGGGQYDYGVGTNWLYVFLNYLALSAFPSEGGAYIAMGLMNIILSTVSPFLLLPIIRDALPDDRTFARGAILFLALALLWPQALILSSHNLKDVLTQTLTSLYLLSFWSFFLRDPTRKWNPRELLVTATVLGIILLLIFSVRTYLAVILAAVSMLLLAPRKPLLALLGFLIVAAFYFVFEDRLAFGVQSSSWLFDAGAKEDLLNAAFDWGDVNARVNYEIGPILASAARFFLAPFPSIGGTWLLVVQSVIVYSLFYFAIKGIGLFGPGIKQFALGLFFFLALFYGVAEIISGPRQRFAPFDFLFLSFAIAGIVRSRRHEAFYALLSFAVVYLFARFCF